MEEKTVEKVLTRGMMAVVMALVLAQIVKGLIPSPQYACPICGEKFMTYDELYSHFTTEHPAEPIEVIWD